MCKEKPDQPKPEAGEFVASFRRIINTADPAANSKITEDNKTVKVLADWGRIACDVIDQLEAEKGMKDMGFVPQTPLTEAEMRRKWPDYFAYEREYNKVKRKNAKLRTRLIKAEAIINRSGEEKGKKCYQLEIEKAELQSRLTAKDNEIERLKELFERICTWSKAYPIDVFLKPDLKKAHKVLKAAGMTLDAISAEAMRHVLEGVMDIASEALKENK